MNIKIENIEKDEERYGMKMREGDMRGGYEKEEVELVFFFFHYVKRWMGKGRMGFPSYELQLCPPLPAGNKECGLYLIISSSQTPLRSK